MLKTVVLLNIFEEKKTYSLIHFLHSTYYKQLCNYTSHWSIQTVIRLLGQVE